MRCARVLSSHGRSICAKGDEGIDACSAAGRQQARRDRNSCQQQGDDREGHGIVRFNLNEHGSHQAAQRERTRKAERERQHELDEPAPEDQPRHLRRTRPERQQFWLDTASLVCGGAMLVVGLSSR